MTSSSASGDGDGILVVEDNPVSRRLMRLVLTSSGFRVTEAADGRGALDAAGREPPDLVLQDLQLPDVDGLGLPARFRSIAGCSDVPIVAVTGFLTNPDPVRIRELGFSECLVKPVERTRLVSVVRRLLPAASQPNQSAGHGRRIVVADDDPVQRTMVSVRLQQEGFRVVAASDGAEALDLARRGSVDAVVSDVLMPRLDGFQLCLGLRADPATSRLPVVLLTSEYDEAADRALAIACGADAYCLRTPDLDDALGAVLAALRAPHAPQASPPTTTVPATPSEPGGPAPITRDAAPVTRDAAPVTRDAAPITRDAAPVTRETPTGEVPREQYLARIVHQLEAQVAAKAAVERRLSVAEAEVAILAGLAEQLKSAATIESSLAAVLYRTIDAAGFSCGVVFLRTAADGFATAARCGIPDSRWPTIERWLRDQDVLSRVLSGGRPVAVALPDEVDLSLRSALHAARARTLLGVPLVAGHEPVGVLLIGCPGPAPADWPAFASAIGSHVGYAIGLSRGMLRLADSERRFRELVDGLDAVVWEADARTLRFSYVSSRTRDLLGLEPEEWTRAPDFWTVVHPTDGLRARRVLREAVRSGRDTVELELGACTADGRPLRVRHSVRILRDAGGRTARLRGVMLDVTEREATARRNAVQLAVTEALADSPGVAEAAPRILRALLAGFGWSVGTLWLFDEDGEGVRCADVQVAEGVEADLYLAALRGAGTAPARGILDRVRRAKTHVWVPHIAIEPETRHTSEALAAGLRTAVAFPLRMDDRMLGAVMFLDAQRIQAPDAELLRMMAAIGSQVGQFARRAQAEARLEERVVHAAFSADVASALNQGESFDAMLAECARAIAGPFGADTVTMWMLDPSGARLESRAGAGPGWDPDAHRETVTVGAPGVGRVAQQRRPAMAVLVGAGSLRPERSAGRDVLASAGFPLVVQGDLLGVVEVRTRSPLTPSANAALTAAADVIALGAHRRMARDENRFLGEQLVQARKLEAVGRLAGGVSHDFNNLLTVITGYATFALAEPGVPPEAHRFIDEVVKAAERAADLTHRLLAFSRKQVLAPTLLDLNDVVTALAPMLERVVGEDVDVVTDLAPGLGWCSADRGQIEQVLMNLVVNARDAMPGGGRLRIVTSDIVLDEVRVRACPGRRPGPYVQIEASDTGVGMEPAVLQRVFEPFFTTKPSGRGTGLGLATVHGIVMQSGGLVEVESAPGAGSTFRILLPRVEAPGDRSAPPAPRSPADARGTETVLVVEDEEPLRAMAVRVLRGAGYTTLDAADGEDATSLCALHDGRIDLVLTDVIMPRMGGRALAARLAKERPNVAVLFMSGYPDAATAQQILSAPDTPFLPKPFTPAELRRKVRDVLDGVRR